MNRISFKKVAQLLKFPGMAYEPINRYDGFIFLLYKLRLSGRGSSTAMINFLFL